MKVSLLARKTGWFAIILIMALSLSCARKDHDDEGDVTAEEIFIAKIDSPARSIGVFENEPINFQGSVSGGTAPYTYTWDFGGGAPASSVEDPGKIAFDTAGKYYITFTAADANGDTISASVVMYIIAPPNLPEVTILSPQGNITINQGESIDFQSSVSKGIPPYTYLWNFSGIGGLKQYVEDPGVFTFNTPGIYSIGVTVYDSVGYAGIDFLTVTVTPLAENQGANTQPQATIASPLNNVTVIAGQSVNFLGAVSGGNAPYMYSWDFGGGAANSNIQNPGDVTFNAAGTYTVILYVTDADGDTDSQTITVTVEQDTLPTANITSPSGNVDVTVGAKINFIGSVSSGNAPFTYEWDFRGGAANSDVKDPGDVTFNNEGTYYVTFTVIDANGDRGIVSVTVTVNK